MLTRLTPEQVSNFWDVIKYAVEESLPPITGEHPDRMNHILSALLSGKAQCWASYARIGEVGKFEGIVLTRILVDDLSMTKNLLIYCLYGYEEVEEGSWLTGLKALIKFAKSRNCSRIIAYSEIPYIIKLASKLGAETNYTFVSFNLNKIVQNLTDLLEL